ncbi:MAG: hypothetical protein ACRCZI_04360 [Cetobacterium sp.]
MNTLSMNIFFYHIYMIPKREKDGTLIFPDYVDFRPNLTPREIILEGAFCNGYFRRVYSTIAKRYLTTDDYKKYPFLKDLPKELMITDIDKKHDHKVNKYRVHASLPLIEWEKSNWIKGSDFRGNYQWYCEFYLGRRNKEIDEYQIKRWNGIAGEKSGRFRKNLIRQIYDSKKKFNDASVSPGIRQTLHHWYYQLTEEDYNEGVKDLLEKRKKETKKNLIKKKTSKKKTSKKKTSKKKTFK